MARPGESTTRVPIGLSGRQRQDCSRDVPYSARLPAPNRPPPTDCRRPPGGEHQGHPPGPAPARGHPA
ncbi:hypothetical protein EYS09_21700, partial [Streptomyces kasugaensis]